MVTYGITLIGILVAAVFVGAAWRLSRARAETRWRAALDRYAEQEQAKETDSRRRLPVRPQSKAG